MELFYGPRPGLNFIVPGGARFEVYYHVRSVHESLRYKHSMPNTGSQYLGGEGYCDESTTPYSSLTIYTSIYSN
jgi:hypothetical protein